MIRAVIIVMMMRVLMRPQLHVSFVLYPAGYINVDDDDDDHD